MVIQRKFCDGDDDGDDNDDGMRIVLMVDLRCCEGCRARICRSLKRIPGVDEAFVCEDRTMLTVVGQKMDEEEVLRRVREKKAMAKILEVHIPLKKRKAADAEKSTVVSAEESAELQGKKEKDLGGKAKGGGKGEKSDGKIGEKASGGKGQEKMAAQRGDTLVSERTHVGMGGGVTIRTRVTTTHDACTCLVLEETLFRIDKQAAAAASS